MRTILANFRYEIGAEKKTCGFSVLEMYAKIIF